MMTKFSLPISIQSRRRDRAVILDLQGQLVLGPSLAAFSEKTRAALDPPPELLVLNMAGVPRMDSLGLGELILLHSRASPKGVRVVLASAPERIRELLSITRMDAIFPHFADEGSAMAAVPA